MAEALARSALRRRALGAHLAWWDATSSTNDRAMEAAASGAAHGSVCAAGYQTAGRGRLGRAWQSPAGVGLYFSVVLHLPGPVAPLVTLAAGVAVADGIRASTGLAVQLKWPNDIWVDGRKLGGILSEMVRMDAARAVVVTGIGVNLAPAALPPDLAGRATSIETELGRAVDRGLVLAEILVALEERTRQLAEGGSQAVLADWRAHASSLMGRRVAWERDGEVVEGRATDVDETGALVVRTASGVERIVAGEVSWT